MKNKEVSGESQKLMKKLTARNLHLIADTSYSSTPQQIEPTTATENTLAAGGNHKSMYDNWQLS